MSLHIYENLEQGSDEWLEARRGLLTASVIGSLITAKTLKVADNEASRRLTAQLVAERILGWSEPAYFNDDMQRGHDVEPIARDLYSETRAPVTEVGFMVGTYGPRTPDDPEYRIGYSPDGLVDDDGLIEVKAPRAKTHMLTHLSGEVPIGHMAQIQTGLLVSGRQWCDFISYCGGMPPFIKRVEADEKWFNAINDAAEKFERDATEMQANYLTKTDGLPSTDRLVIDMEMSF